MTVIDFKDVWEMYRIKFIIDGKARWEDFWALQGISFSVDKGQVVGIIGENGSGKSTVLRLISGMLKPDRGEVKVSGSVSGLLELGAGFQPELTGRENILLQLELFGVASGETKERFQRVIEFAEIGRFIDAPVKCYSQGMFVRLAFAVAVHMDSDIFLVDDTLAVGDEYFQKKCIKEIFKIKEKGRTVVIVTHDMAMLKKLCARTIFLKKGVLVKDDETSRTVSFYSQTVGSPKGIAVIEKKQFGLIFNNGRLLLSWAGKMITLPCGAYTSSVVDGFWYSSCQADWEVKESAGQITATGKFYHLSMSQVWRLAIDDDSQLKWDIEIELENDIRPPEVYINIALSEGYEEWFADTEKGVFPEIKEEDRKWKVIPMKSASSVCIGVYGRDSSSLELPSLIFEQADSRYRFQSGILNSDYLNQGRLLQYKASLSSLSPSGQANRFICFSGKMLAGIPDVDAYVRQRQKEFIVSAGSLKLVFDGGRLAVFFDGIPLTKAGHIYSAFFMDRKWFTSDSASWVIKKEAENRLIACGKWGESGISQVWTIEARQDNSFICDVQERFTHEARIEQQRLRCFFSEEFDSFLAGFSPGEFGDTFSDTDSDLLKRCVASGEVKLRSSIPDLPSISLSFAEGLGNFVKIFNSDYYNKARILHLEKVEPQARAVFSPGEHNCFRARFSLLREEAGAAGRTSNAIVSGDTKFVFDNGRGRLYRGQEELTKNLALYTSVRSGGKWFDSLSSACWKVVYGDGRQIRVTGKWLDLPLVQDWSIRLVDVLTFDWDVVLRVEKGVELDRLQANIMLSEMFSQWSSGRHTGVFPDFRGDIDDDWDCLWAAEGGEYMATLQGDPGCGMPDISLAVRPSDPKWSLKILNSDMYHRGRLLQCSSAFKTKLPPADYPYFSGKLTIADRRK